MGHFAYRTTGYAIKTLSDLSRARVSIFGRENIPDGSIIFAVNHFTRIETLLIPYHINRIINMPVWSLADFSLFEGSLGAVLNRLGALSTRNPHRDLLIVKTLLTGEAAWVIFPEGRMVKNKKVFEKGWKKERFMIEAPDGKHPPHTGTASLALRTEFYRQRIAAMQTANPAEATRLMELYQIESVASLSGKQTYIVPVNITYYPIRARENFFSRMADLFFRELPERIVEEVMTEGTMLLAGVDVDIRFGEPIRIGQYMKSAVIQKDIHLPQPIDFDDELPSRRMMKLSAQKIMQRYMAAIYNLTTVNHDHIFATLLKYLPVNEIDEDEFRCRAYLATSADLSKMAVHRHRSLNQNQIHLLTDDRFQKVENFLALCLEKKVIKRQGHVIVRDRSFSEGGDFHRVRIDNPVLVIANEIEPLNDLQTHLKRLAWQPGIRIKFWTAKQLQDKMTFDFEKDYSQYELQQEHTKEKHVGRPFLIKNPSREIGVVLVHGYMAAPLEVRALAQFLGSRGYWVCVPRLSGHGTSPNDLARRTYMEWVLSVEEAYGIIKNTCKRVVMGGFSTGAGLALDMCARVPDIAAVFAISPPLKLQHFSTRFVPAVHLWNRLMKKFSFESAQKEFVENNPENPHINYHRNPISGLMELERLMNDLETKLSRITVPAMVIQGYGDPVVDPEGSRQIYEHLGSEDKEYLLVNAGRHGIINGEKAWRIYQAVELFLERIIGVL
ncbi:MAG: alpha/beta fold hydrolase [Thermodesulfobacteriota bacterium]